MRSAVIALAALCPFALVASGCADSRVDLGKGLIASEAAVEASANIATANAATMSPDLKAKTKAGIDAANQGVVAAHGAYDASKGAPK